MARKMAVVGAVCLLAVVLTWPVRRDARGPIAAAPAPAVTLAQLTTVAEDGPAQVPAHAPPQSPAQVAPQIPPENPASVTAPMASSAEAKIRRALSVPVTLDVESETLADFARRLADMLQIEIVLDENELAAGEGAQKPVKLRVAGVSAKAALEIALSQVEMDWAVHHEVVWITTAEAAEKLTATKVYPITDLVAGSSPDDATPHRSLTVLIDLITSSIAKSSWDEVGGAGTICPYHNGATYMLVISQTRSAHEALADLLVQLRAVANLKPLPVESPLVAPPPLVVPRSNAPRPAPTPGKSTPAARSPDALDSIVTSNNRFACKLFDQVAQQSAADKPGNLLISPYGVWSCLGLINRGAQGETADEIAEALSFDSSAEETQAQQRALRLRMAAASGGILTLRIAEHLWAQPGPASNRLAAAGGESFPLSIVDFQHPQLACDVINQWVSKATDGKISHLVQPDGLNDDSRFIITSALYFHAPWQKPFEAASTKPAVFHTFERDIETPTMELTADYGYAKVGDLQVLEKKYAGGKLSMVILLPPSGAERFRKLETELSAESVASGIASVRQQKVRLRLPKFKIACEMKLKPSLERVGLTRIFDLKKADLFGPATTDWPLYITEVFHKTLIEVNEEGTEAAAATATIGAPGGMEEMTTFNADHPFLFLIRHRATGAILFIGRVMDPSSA